MKYRRLSRIVWITLIFICCMNATPIYASSLSLLIDHAEKNHPNLELATAKVEAARADVAQAGAAWFPTASLTSKTSYSDARFGHNRSQTSDFLPMSVALEQLLWDWGKTSAAKRAAVERVMIAETNFATDRSKISLNVTEKYIAAILARSLLSLREHTVDDRASLRERIGRLVDSGVRPRSDATRAEIDLANARTQLDAARARVATSEEELRDAVGTDALPAFEYETMPDNTPPLPMESGTLLGGADRRPEVIAAGFTVEAERAEHKSAQRALLPTVSATGSYGRGERTITSTTNAVDVTTTRSQPLTEWSGALAFGWSGFNFAARRATVRKEAAEVAQAVASLKEIKRVTDVEIKIAVVNLTEALNRIRTTEAVLAAASENYQLIRRRYEAGVSSILDITDGQVQITDAEAAVLQAKADAWVMNARLRRVAAAPSLR